VKRKKLPTLSSLEKKLDKVFSEYIRRKDADEGGTVACVTCGKLFHWKEVHCGHFVKRQHRAVRWDVDNAGPQCVRDNLHMGGRQDDFAIHILASKGRFTLDRLMAAKYKPVKFTRADLEKLIEGFKEKLEGLNGLVR